MYLKLMFVFDTFVVSEEFWFSYLPLQSIPASLIIKFTIVCWSNKTIWSLFMWVFPRTSFLINNCRQTWSVSWLTLSIHAAYVCVAAKLPLREDCVIAAQVKFGLLFGRSIRSVEAQVFRYLEETWLWRHIGQLQYLVQTRNNRETRSIYLVFSSVKNKHVLRLFVAPNQNQNRKTTTATEPG